MSEPASAYSTVVVGTDGSGSSLPARAGAVADACGENADLLVVGNGGLNGSQGRLLGPVSADATRRSPCDVLVVHTTD